VADRLTEAVLSGEDAVASRSARISQLESELSAAHKRASGTGLRLCDSS
jgi:hypothetical protein